MVSLDPVLDSANDQQVGQYIDADTRNHLAFLELRQYEQHKTFLFKHPILLDYKQENELKQLLISNAGKFMTEIVNTQNNINRYQSYINNKKYKNDDELSNWLAIIKQETNTLTIMQRLISK